MAKVRFKKNPYLSEPYVRVDGLTFGKYGDTRNVELDIARLLIQDFPYAFEALEELPPPPSPSTEPGPDTIRVRFLATSGMPSYHSLNINFFNDGQEEEIDADEGNRLLALFPDNFAVVLDEAEAEVEESEEVQESGDVQDRIKDAILQLGGKATLSEIAEFLGVKRARLNIPIYRGVSSEIFDRINESGQNYYQVAGHADTSSDDGSESS